MTATHDFFKDLVGALGPDSQNKSNLEQFDDRRFRFGLYLVNPDARAVKIRKGSIQELIIEDDLLEWFHKGHIIFNNPDDVIERVETQLNTETPSGDKVNIQPYRFRGDARDMIYMFMEPHLSDEETSQELNSSVHTMRFLFSIYAVEDIESPKGKKYKQQKLYFHDYRLQLLREKTLYYSTAKHPKKLGENITTTTNITQQTNSARSKPTGEIILDILSATLPVDDTVGQFSAHWEFGDEKIFYTSPAQHKAIDDLNYILDRHVSSAKYSNQPCILKLQRHTERWELLPITSYFSRAVSDNKSPGPYQSEFFTLSFDSEATPTEIPPPSKTFGADQSSPMINYHFPDISIIEDYTFSEMNGVDCQEILNSVCVHRYDEKTKQFSVDLREGNIGKVHSDFQTLFINNTMGGDSGKGFTSWLTDSTRIDNLNIGVEPSWSPMQVPSLSVGRNKKLLAGLLLGNSIQFKVKGLTARRSGVWIAIDRENNYVDSEYEGKVLGQYFITRVIHRINPQGYTNVLIGVKPYLYKTSKFNTNDIFYKQPENIEY
jgi:hypothetical protein